MVKLIRVKCRRPTDAEDDEPYAGVAFAADKAHAEQLCRDALTHRGYTSFEAEEPVEGHSRMFSRKFSYLRVEDCRRLP
jgi:hypothetical protein